MSVHRRTGRTTRALAATSTALLVLTLVPTAAAAQIDGRAGLLAGQEDSTPNLERLDSLPNEFGGFNSDLAFSGDLAFVGNYEGFAVYDISDPENLELRTTVSCPGGQNDVSVHGDLLFLSVESGGFTACDDGSGAGSTRFAGVRVFDISDLDRPEQIAAVQTCRGSHTHTLVDDPSGRNVYVYVSGVTSVRSDAADVGLDCSSVGPDDRTDSRWRVDIVEVPLAAPADARLVGGPRLFAEGGDIDGLQQQTPTPTHPSGEPWLPEPITDACHDITAYPEAGLAAGACEGNGILVDITDPVNPVRVAAVADDNFAYWHSATFNDDATKVVFTDEWGGGIIGHCDPVNNSPEWGANGIYDITANADGTYELELASYYKIPNTQTKAENCVAHNGNLVPVPGRDVMVQAWYQGGLSVFDFTDSANPVELAWFDRGPYVPGTDGPVFELPAAGFWSTYYHQGIIYGSEIGRGFESFRLLADDQLSAAELSAAAAATNDQSNAQTQTRYGSPLPALRQPRVPCSTVRPVSFPDISGPPHGDNVACIAGFGIAEGRADGTYRPRNDVRRDQMASFLARMLDAAGVDLPAADRSAFPDARGSTHEDAIGRLAAAGIVEGRRAGVYDPSSSVTRGQMASFLVRTVEFAVQRDLDAGGGPFRDTAGSPHTGNIDVAAQRGITTGRTATTYEPGAPVRRDQMGSFIARTLRVLSSEGFDLRAR